MSSLKKMIAVVVALALVLTSFSTAVFAAEVYYEDYGYELLDMGLIAGGTNGNLMLDQKLERQQGILLVLAILAQKQLSDELSSDETEEILSVFTDANDIAGYARKAVAYALDMGYTTGTGNNKWSPKGDFTGNQLATMLLAALGYKPNYTTALADLLALSDNNVFDDADADAYATSILSRDMVVGILYSALKVPFADEDTYIIDALVAYWQETAANATVEADKLKYEGYVLAAKDYGLVDTVTSGSITARQTGKRKLEVNFGGSVDSEKASFEVKMGSSTRNVDNVAWDAAKKVATLTMSANILEGEYVITVKELGLDPNTFTVKTIESKVSKLEIISKKFAFVNTDYKEAVGYYQATNQFGEDVTSEVSNPYVSSSATTVTAQYKSSLGLGEIYMTFATAQMIGISVSVTLIDQTTTVFASAILELGEPAKADTIVLGDLVIKDNAANVTTDLKLYEGAFNAYYPVTVKDQYGNIMKDVKTINDSLIVSSAVKTRFADYNGNIVVEITGYNGVVGTASDPQYIAYANQYKIMFISMVNAARAEVTLDVKDAIYVASFALDTPADTISKNQTPVLTYQALDQNGNQVKDYDTIKAGVTLMSNNDSLLWYEDYSTGNLTLKLDASKAIGSALNGTVVITAMCLKTGKTDTKYITIRDAAYPAVVEQIKDAKSNILAKQTISVNGKDVIEAGQFTFNTNHIKVKDQYGRDIKYQDYTDNYRVILLSSNSSVVDVVYRNDHGDNGRANDMLYDNAGKGIDINYIKGDNFNKGITVRADTTGSGTAVLTARIMKKDSTTGKWEVMSGGDKTFSMSVVTKDAIESFVLSDPGNIYRYADKRLADGADSKYAKAITVRGKLTSGTEVDLYLSLVSATYSTVAGVYNAGPQFRNEDGRGDSVQFKVYSTTAKQSDGTEIADDKKEDYGTTVIAYATNGKITNAVTREIKFTKAEPKKSYTYYNDWGWVDGIGDGKTYYRWDNEVYYIKPGKGVEANDLIVDRYISDSQARVLGGKRSLVLFVIGDTYGVTEPTTSCLVDHNSVKPVFYTVNQTNTIFKIDASTGLVTYANPNSPKAPVVGDEVTFSAFFSDGSKVDVRIKYE